MFKNSLSSKFAATAVSALAMTFFATTVLAAQGPSHQDLADDHVDLEDDINAHTDTAIGAHEANVLSVLPSSSPAEIDSCPFTITTPGLYVMTGNLSCAGNGIVVNASGVTIDLRGYRLSGSFWSNIGVSGSAAANVTVRNGTISGFMDGVFLNGTEQMTLEKLRVIGNSRQGIQIGNAGVVRDNTVAENGVEGPSPGGPGGITVGQDSLVKDNLVTHNTDGSYGTGIVMSAGSMATGNVVRSHPEGGIAGNGANISQNLVSNNNGLGIIAGPRSAVNGNSGTDNIQITCPATANDNAVININFYDAGGPCTLDHNSGTLNDQD